MTTNEILERLNGLNRERQDIGPTTLEMAIDFLVDDGEPVPEDLSALAAEADRSADHLNQIDAEIEALFTEYEAPTGHRPYFSGLFYSDYNHRKALRL